MKFFSWWLTENRNRENISFFEKYFSTKNETKISRLQFLMRFLIACVGNYLLTMVFFVIIFFFLGKIYQNIDMNTAVSAHSMILKAMPMLIEIFLLWFLFDVIFVLVKKRVNDMGWSGNFFASFVSGVLLLRIMTRILFIIGFFGFFNHKTNFLQYFSPPYMMAEYINVPTQIMPTDYILLNNIQNFLWGCMVIILLLCLFVPSKNSENTQYFKINFFG